MLKWKIATVICLNMLSVVILKDNSSVMMIQQWFHLWLLFVLFSSASVAVSCAI